MSGRVEGILLAAGESRRMGYPKPLLILGGKTFLENICAAMLAAMDRLVIVVGAQAERVRHKVPDDRRITVVDNPDFARGQFSSLKVGLAAVSADAAAAIVHLVDHPNVRAETFRDVIEQYERCRGQIIIARYYARRGHPVLFDRALFAELLSAPEGQGARAVVNAEPGRVRYLEVEDPGVVLDLDTPAELEAAGFAPPPGDRPKA